MMMQQSSVEQAAPVPDGTARPGTDDREVRVAYIWGTDSVIRRLQ